MSQFQIPDRDAFTTSGFVKPIANPNYKTNIPEGPENPEQINSAISPKFESDIAQLFGNTMGSLNEYVTSDLQNLNLINQKRAADSFRNQVGVTKVDEPLEKLAPTHRGQIYFKPDGTLGKGPMGFWEISDASNLFQGNFGLLATEASAMSEKSNIYGTNSLLQRSKAWPKLEEALTISEEDKEQLKDWFEADNNWDRVIEIDNLKDLFEFVPITSQILGLAGETPEEKFLQRKDPNFKAGDLVAAIQSYDPDFYSFLVDEGVDIEKLSKAENPFHFRFLINYRIQSNAIQRSMNAVEKYHSTAVNWALWGADQMRASLTSADFVAQIALTVATGGIGAVVSGAATGINMAKGGLQSVTTTINTATKLRALGQGITNVQKYLPLQLPTTVLERIAPTLVKNNLPSGAAGLGALTLGHAITGAVEEGLTDAINQSYELSTGIRVSYNMDQTMLAIGMGAALEPILGGAFKVASIPINITLSGVSRLGSLGTQKAFSFTFGVDPSRFKEFGLYMDAVTGKNFNDLSPDEAEERIRIIANRLVIEAALNKATNNAFGKIENNTELLGFIHAILKSDQLATVEGIQQGITTLAAKVLSIKEDLDTGMVQDENGNWVRKSQFIAQQAPSLFSVDENGFVQFTQQGVQALLISMAVDNITTDAQRAEAISSTILAVVMNNERKALLENEGFKTELEKITDPEQREELIRNRLMEMVTDPTNTVIQDRIKELQGLFDLISQHLPESKVAVNEEQNLEPETTAAFKQEAAELDEENNNAVDSLLEETKPTVPSSIKDEPTNKIDIQNLTETRSKTLGESLWNNRQTGGWKIRLVVKDPTTGKPFTSKSPEFLQQAKLISDRLKELFPNESGTFGESKFYGEGKAKTSDKPIRYKFLSGGDIGTQDFTVYLGSVEERNSFIQWVKDNNLTELLAVPTELDGDVSLDESGLFKGRIEGVDLGLDGYGIPYKFLGEFTKAFNKPFVFYITYENKVYVLMSSSPSPSPSDVFIGEVKTNNQVSGVDWELQKKLSFVFRNKIIQAAYPNLQAESIVTSKPVSKTEIPTPLTKDQQQQIAGKQIAVNLNFAVEKGTISSLEIEMIKKRLSQIKTIENAANFRQWAMNHKNKNIGIAIAGELNINEAWNRADNASPEIMANIVLNTLNKNETTTPTSPVATEAAPVATEAVPEDATTIKELANIIPKEFTLPAGYKAESNGLEDDGSIFYNIINTENNLSEGQIYFVWDSKNKLLRPTPPTGVNLYPQAQKKGLYAAWLTEMNKYVDLASSGIDKTSGTMPNAVKVWTKLGAKIESTEQVEAISGDQAYVLRKAVTKAPETAKAAEAAPVAAEAAPATEPTTKLIDANDVQDLPVELQNLVKIFKCS